MTNDEPGSRGIALVGYRATGKSTVGRIIADRLGRPFADADREVEARAGRSIRSIFSEDGEAAFREWETLVLADLMTGLPGGVVATGGGATLNQANRKRLRDFGFVAWLTADAETLTRRLQSSKRNLDDRPPLTAAGTLAEIAEVLEIRTPLYREVAHASIETAGRTAEQVAEAVLEAWSHYLDPARSTSDKGDFNVEMMSKIPPPQPSPARGEGGRLRPSPLAGEARVGGGVALPETLEEPRTPEVGE